MTLPSDDEVRARVARVRARETDGSLEVLGQSGGEAVHLAPPDPSWPAQFDRVRGTILEALGSTALRVDHVGSTAIPDIPAKPIIDVQVSVRDLADEVVYLPALASLGWPLRLREAERRFFREPAGRERRTHIHVCQRGGTWERRHLLFRDFLRAHPDRARRYGRLKLAIADQYGDDRLAYTEAKGPFIDETIRLAEKWAVAVGWSLF